MGTSGALDQCSLGSGETLGMSNHGVGGGVCKEKKKKSRSMQWVKKEPDICVGVGVVEDSSNRWWWRERRNRGNCY